VGSAALLASAARIRAVISQPIAPTEATDLEWTLTNGRSVDGGSGPPPDRDPVPGLDGATAHSVAVAYAREAARPAPAPPGRRRARG
jgi:hypothetical protein